MSKQSGVTRRAFLGGSIAAGAALSAPWFVPARVLGREGAVAPSEKITLGNTAGSSVWRQSPIVFVLVSRK